MVITVTADDSPLGKLYFVLSISQNNSIPLMLSVKILVFQASKHIRQHIAHCGSDDVDDLILRPTGSGTQKQPRLPNVLCDSEKQLKLADSGFSVKKMKHKTKLCTFLVHYQMDSIKGDQ